MNKSTLKAGALLYAVGLSFIIAMMLSSLIVVSSFSHMRFSLRIAHEKLLMNAESGINLLLTDQSTTELDQPMEMDLFGTGRDSVQLNRKSWGAFDVILSEAHSKGERVMKLAFVGSRGKSDTALYMPDKGKPLSLSGKTVLKGTCVLPKAGVQRAFIEGKNFLGEQLVQGAIKTASKYLPWVDTLAINRMASFFDFTNNKRDSLVNISESGLPDTLVNSFNRRTICYYSSTDITIRHKVLSGNILIVAGGKLKIMGNTELKDVILMASEISFEENFSGIVQAFASDSLVVKKGCSLYFPSALGILKKGQMLMSPCLKLAERVKVEGFILGYGQKYDPRYHVSLVIGKGALVRGMVYCNSTTDLQGKIEGSLYTSGITLTTPSSVYENHLLDVTIDATKLPDAYVTAAFFSKSSKRRVIKWLN